MNKLLLISLLSITFIGDVKSNEEHFHKSIGEPLYFTKKEYSPACFYTEDNFQGESVCLVPPMMMDFYDTENYNLNDKISSIKIPEDVHVTVYKNDNYNQPYYKLM
ncbi:TPA: peptidase inhibitor family I36 protein, partial [Yersinia enterocolitica]|nr:peptidase inhibitor family I36 protein [Yersinia enterocolitica]